MEQTFEGPRHAATHAHHGAIRQAFVERLPASLATIERAIQLSLRCHRDQKDRPNGSPYVEHPAEVAHNVVDWTDPLDPDLVVAALLHDSVEDQAAVLCEVGGEATVDRTAALAVIEAGFGARARSLVAHLTNPEPTGTPTAEEKRAAYLHHVQELAADAPDAYCVKLADLWTNALRLDGIADDRRRQSLSRKYRPVLEDALARLLSAPPGPIAAKAPELAAELRSALAGMSASD
jgi:(p)ppGpp synthase/HD superfamily hydrolase